MKFGALKFGMIIQTILTMKNFKLIFKISHFIFQHTKMLMINISDT